MQYIVGNNWGLDTILDLVITSLVLQTRGVNNSQRYGVHEGCGKAHVCLYLLHFCPTVCLSDLEDFYLRPVDLGRGG